MRKTESAEALSGRRGRNLSQCCGSQREITIECPASCEYLKEARFHEQPPAVTEDQVPNPDIRLTEKFLRDTEPLVFTLALALKSAMESGGAVDFDAREALEAEIRTYRTMHAGLIYDTRAPNPYAAAIQQKLRQAVEEFSKELSEQRGMATVRDADVLGVLVFLQRLEMRYNNGRRRGRAFRDFLTGYLPEAPAPAVLV